MKENDMGNDRRNKGLVFDEADFSLPPNYTAEALYEVVENHCFEEFDYGYGDPYANPTFELLGMVSESFKKATDEIDDHSIWLKPGVGFQDIFLEIACGLDVPETVALEAITTGQTDALEEVLSRQIRAHLDASQHYSAQELTAYLADLKSTALLGARHENHFDTYGDEMIIDFRGRNYGPGRRILVEIAYNWGQ